MARLSDKEIRAALLNWLNKGIRLPKAVLEEVRVHNGNAIADVVAVHSFLHCYEIKGETDSIGRILKQGPYYDQAFKRTTLVTTANHLSKAQLLSPRHWGLIVATDSNTSSIKFRYIRAAQNSPDYSKQVALMTLWRSELLELNMADSTAASKLNRLRLTETIASRISEKELGEKVGDFLIGRHLSLG